MDIKEYISSGIIEAYVMGLASETEKSEFEQNCTLYPELVAAREAFEEQLEQQFTQEIVEPPADLKARVFNAVKAEGIETAKIIPLQPAAGARQKRRPEMFVAAALVIIMLVSSVFIYYLRSQRKQLEQSNNELQAGLQSRDSLLNKLVDEQKLLNNPGIKKVNMVGSNIAPSFTANIYWDSASAAVYLVIKNIPRLPDEKQYQLWAVTKGMSKSLGVFNATEDRVILKMDNTQNAESFAITIEPKGGSTSPSTESIQSSGNPL